MLMFSSLRRSSCVLAALLCSAPLWAQTATPVVQVQGAWARATVPGQQASGAFMQLKASQASTLVAASSPVAASVEVHEMKMAGDVMQMRALEAGLPLPAGKTVALQPGGLHLMLMGLKQPLLKDSVIPLTLEFQNAQGQKTTQQLHVPVAASAPAHSH